MLAYDLPQEATDSHAIGCHLSPRRPDWKASFGIDVHDSTSLKSHSHEAGLWFVNIS